jgi:hypothetical protein
LSSTERESSKHAETLSDAVQLALGERRGLLARHLDAAPVRALEAADEAQERALAGSTAPHQDRDAATRKHAAQVLEDGPGSQPELDFTDLDMRVALRGGLHRSDSEPGCVQIPFRFGLRDLGRAIGKRAAL